MRPLCALTGCCNVSQIGSVSMTCSCVGRLMCAQYRACSVLQVFLLSLRRFSRHHSGKASLLLWQRATHTAESVCKSSSRCACAFCMARNTFKRRRCCMVLSLLCVFQWVQYARKPAFGAGKLSLRWPYPVT